MKNMNVRWREIEMRDMGEKGGLRLRKGEVWKGGDRGEQDARDGEA